MKDGTHKIAETPGAAHLPPNAEKPPNDDHVDIIDISPVVNSSFPVFPGDTVFNQTSIIEMAEVSSNALGTLSSTHLHNPSVFSLSQFTMSPHCGAHVDSPSHFDIKGASIERLSLDPFIGPCIVVEVSVKRNSRVNVQDLPADFFSGPLFESTQLPPRILFRTSSFDYRKSWQEDFVALDPELIYFLDKKGVRLIGIDTPSVDLANDQELAAHQALAKTGIRNLENLDLKNTISGSYTLIALPLKLAGLEASPIRAILLKKGAKTWLFPQE